MKPLIWKELRENVRWLPIGLVVVGAACWIVRPNHQNYNVLLATDLLSQLLVVAPILAFALGIVQSYRDLQNAAGAYLNHRCITARDVFLAKVFSGFALYATAILVPVACLALWIQYKGLWWYPMRPAQVVPGLMHSFAAFVMHPAAMLMMVRGASWWGTRVMPLIPAGAFLALHFGWLQGGDWWDRLSSLGFATLALAWMIAIARPAWQRLAPDPPGSRVNSPLRSRLLLPTYLLVGVTGASMGAVAFAIGMIEEMSRETVSIQKPYLALAVVPGEDDVWLINVLVEYDRTTGISEETIFGGEIITPGTRVDVDSTSTVGHDLKQLGRLWVRMQHFNDGFFSQLEGGSLAPFTVAYDMRGYLLCYDTYPNFEWKQTITADGIRPPGVLAGKPLNGNPLAGSLMFSAFSEAGYDVPLVHGDGVMMLEKNPMRLRSIIDAPIDGGTLVNSEPGHAPRLILRSGKVLTEYKFVDESGDDKWYVAPEDGENRRIQLKGIEVKLSAEKVRSFIMPDELVEHLYPFIAWTPSGLYLSPNTNLYVYRLTPDGAVEKIDYDVDPRWKPVQPDEVSLVTIVAGFFPGAGALFACVMSMWAVGVIRQDASPLQDIVSYPIVASTAIVSFLIATALALWLVWWIARRRGLSVGQTRLWTGGVFVLGLAAPLAMVAMYRKVYRETCTKCSGPRRVDQTHCEHCGAAWLAPASEGIEIVDRAASLSAIV